MTPSVKTIFLVFLFLSVIQPLVWANSDEMLQTFETREETSSSEAVDDWENKGVLSPPTKENEPKKSPAQHVPALLEKIPYEKYQETYEVYKARFIEQIEKWRASFDQWNQNFQTQGKADAIEHLNQYKAALGDYLRQVVENLKKTWDSVGAPSSSNTPAPTTSSNRIEVVPYDKARSLLKETDPEKLKDL